MSIITNSRELYDEIIKLKCRNNLRVNLSVILFDYDADEVLAESGISSYRDAGLKECSIRMN